MSRAIAVWIGLLPGQPTSADVFKAALGAPAESINCLTGIGDADGCIAWPSVCDRVGDGTVAGGFHGLYDVQNRLSLTAAEIEGEQLRFFTKQAVEGAAVPFCKIHYMDVIPHACSIGSGPVTAEYLQRWSEANGHLAHKGEKVVGNAMGILTDPSGGMGANGVEITQAYDSPGCLVRGLQVGQHLLYCSLGMATRVDRCNRSGLGWNSRDSRRWLRCC